MPRKDQGWITFQLPEAERQLLEDYCKQTQRGKTDILRELVRTLTRWRSRSVGIASASAERASIAEPSPIWEKSQSSDALEIQPMRVSARNVFPAEIRRVTLGSINAEITLEIAPGVEIVSVITRSSSEALGLTPGKLAYTVIKSSDVMVAVDGFE
jgi:molybdopterin-binding protein